MPKLHVVRYYRSIVIRHYRLLLLILVVVIMALKGPDLLIHPRIWAEEVYYLNYSLTHGLWDSLLYSSPSLGYYLLTANVPSVLAAGVSRTRGLEYAPFVTTYFSFLIQLLPFVVLLYGNSRLFKTPALVATGCALILFAGTSSGEIWFTSIHTKNWIGLTVFLLLFEDMSGWSPARTWFFRVVVLFCGLSGPYSVITFPLFAIAYRIYGDKEKLVHAGLLAGCFFLDVIVSIAEARAGHMGIRTSDFTLDSAIVNIFAHQVLQSLLGGHAISFARHSLGLASAVRDATAVPRPGRVILPAIGAAAVMATTLKLFWSKLRSTQTLLVASFLLFAAFTALTSLWAVPHNRYAFLPGVAFLFLLLSVWSDASQTKRVVAVALLACALYSGIRDYPKYWIENSEGQPSWTNEVRKWREDPAYKPLVWPSSFGARVEWHPDIRR